MLNTLPRPLVVAHRGASAHAPENTLAAFRLAINEGAPALELDAKLSADEQIVVIHDPTVDRTTDGTGRVNEMTLAQLRELDAGCKFSDSYRGERLPALAEVLEEVGGRAAVNIELTNYTSPGDGLVERVVELVRRMDCAKWVFFSSFDPRNLARARKLLPQIELGLLVIPSLPGQLARPLLERWVPHDSLHPALENTNNKLVDAAHARGKPVFVWTVNLPADMRALVSIGADGFFTDDPKLGLQLVGGKR